MALLEAILKAVPAPLDLVIELPDGARTCPATVVRESPEVVVVLVKLLNRRSTVAWEIVSAGPLVTLIVLVPKLSGEAGVTAIWKPAEPV